MAFPVENTLSSLVVFEGLRGAKFPLLPSGYNARLIKVLEPCGDVHLGDVRISASVLSDLRVEDLPSRVSRKWMFVHPKLFVPLRLLRPDLNLATADDYRIVEVRKGNRVEEILVVRSLVLSRAP